MLEFQTHINLYMLEFQTHINLNISFLFCVLALESVLFLWTPSALWSNSFLEIMVPDFLIQLVAVSYAENKCR